MKFLLKSGFIFILIFQLMSDLQAQEKRLRDFGIKPGVLSPGPLNSITDVEGITVGHTTLIIGDSIRTGVTAILPHQNNIFQSKVPASLHIGNGFGKLMGISQIEELGNLETPIILTNTLSVPTAANALISYTFDQNGNESVQSVNAVVGETNDGFLNDIRGRHVKEEHVIAAIENAGTLVEEGNVGAGTGTRCFGFKGGIGTSSRKLPNNIGGYTVGVLVQTNFGGVLTIDGNPVGKTLKKHYLADKLNESADGSCMIIVSTDAPLDTRNLKRIAKRAMLGLAKTGGIASNGSGDYIIAFSAAKELQIAYQAESPFYETKTLRNEHMSSLFLATIEATEEAILNSLIAAKTMKGKDGRILKALPIEEVLELMSPNK